ncbi:MAG: diguanylate cyclase [Rhodobacteraceae bacterium]|nr:MAG: diguanylate cyclase [Paracoccaceae bacterium]
MSTDIHLAFAHPSERAAATEGAAPRDRISLRDHIAEVEIGAFQSERGQTQRVRFNVVVEVARQGDRIDDDVDRILSYDRVTEAIAHELREERLNLLETLAERVAERILREPRAMRVFVRIEKLDRGPGALGVEIVRGPEDLDPALVGQMSGQGPHPRVVYLSNAAIASSHLTGWIDWLAGAGAPVVLCLGLPDTDRPCAAHPLAQRRVDLLAIEQNCWVLAARDPRCVVVGTRTELDWGMKHGQISLWAPSKIVLDAVEGPKSRPRDSVALAAWLAEHLEATELLVIGEALPVAASVPLRAVDSTSATLA